jgi:hypothetical protein
MSDKCSATELHPRSLGYISDMALGPLL